MNKKIPKILELYENYLKSTIKLSNQIMFTLEDTKPWESKLGGCPYLEDIEQYPKGTDGGPMMFLAQINLAEMPPLPEFQDKFQNISKKEEKALFELCCASGSRVGGYPYFVQRAPAYYKDSSEYILLLQLDVDDTSGLMFGDSGNCTFIISRRDLLAGNFTKVHYDWQCC